MPVQRRKRTPVSETASSRLIYGFHAVLAKLRHDPEAIFEIYVDAKRTDPRARDLLRHARRGERVTAFVNELREKAQIEFV